MKKILLMCLIVSLCAGFVFAGGIDNKSNLSAGYVRQPSKNTESESPDAIFYNPAGTAYMEDGIYAEVDNQMVFKEYSHEISGTEYKNDNPIWLLPSAMFVYKKDKLAVFNGLGFVGGGGALYYEDGTATTASMAALAPGIEDEEMDIDSYYLGETLGASYKVTDDLSISLAGRIIFATSSKEVKGDFLNLESSATGYGAILGIHYKLNDKTDLTMQYQTITKMEWEYDTVESSSANLLDYIKDEAVNLDSLSEGDKYDRDLPAVLGLGGGYAINDQLYINLSFNYYFNKQATIETGLMGGKEELDNSWEIGTGVEYDLNEKTELSAGLLYSNQGFNDDNNSYENPYNDSLTIGLGGEYEVIDNLKVQLGLLKAIYFEEEYSSAKLNKAVTEIALGVSYQY